MNLGRETWRGPDATDNNSHKGLEEFRAMKRKIVTAFIGLSLVTLVTGACGTVGGAAVGAGAGAAVGAGTGYGAGKGALIGTGVGAAAGAIYDVTRH